MSEDPLNHLHHLHHLDPDVDPGVDPEPAPFDVCGDLPTGTVLLEASAGTGKTWTIAALVVRHVAEGVARLEEMLVLTFGRAASQELRSRVREALVETERVLATVVDPQHPATAADPGTDDRLLLHLLSDQGVPRDPDEVSRRHGRVRDALVGFDAATIATTHQFCQLVLRSLGVAGDTETGAELVEDLDDLVVEVVDDLYVRGFARSADPPAFDRRTALEVARAAVGDPQARLTDAGSEPGSVRQRRVHFARAVRDELAVRKRRLGLLSYDDLLSRLADALEADDSPARTRMRDRWSLVLVDEFQDTDPVQWQVLDRAFSGHATLVLVGDPKQAIYGFRGGDVVTYLDAAATAGHRATLATNHRSDRALVDSLHTLLRGARLGDPRIVVRPVEAAHEGPRLVGAPSSHPFRLRLLDREALGATRGKEAPIGRARARVAQDLAADVAALLTSGAQVHGRPVEPGDVAVLCARRRDGETAREALAAVGVRAVVGGSGGVLTTEGADEWLTLLEAMEQPQRSGRVRAAALGCFLGRDPRDLERDSDRQTEEVSETVRDWADLARRRGVAAVLERSVAEHDLYARVLARTDGERMMTDLRHVGEVLHDTALREGLSVTALAAWLRRHRDDERSGGAEERTRRLDSDSDAVQVLTIHGSKGLQFPVVYLPTLGDLHVSTPAMPRFHDEQGRRTLDVGGGPPAEHVRRAEVEARGEDLRLLYVATTRAQCQLVTWWFPNAKNTTSSALHRMLVGRAVDVPDVPEAPDLPDDTEVARRAGLWQQAGAATVERVVDRGEVEGPPPPDPVPLRARTWTRAVDQSWRRTSYSALTAAAEALAGGADLSGPGDPGGRLFGSEAEQSPRDDEVDVDVTFPALGVDPAADVPSPMADLPAGATFGSLVHAVLEHVDPAAPKHGGDLAAALHEQVARQSVRWPVRGFGAPQAAQLVTALEAVLGTPLGRLAPGLTLGTLARRDRLPELDFELPLGGGDDRDGVLDPARLDGLAPLLRTHLAADDPLRAFADRLDTPGYAAQRLHGYLTGSLDVVLRHDGRYLVADYKTNLLGSRDEPSTVGQYAPAALAEAMRGSTYPLQALLYAVVLHRFLRWRLPDYDPGTHLGGVLYLYVRGMAGPDTPLVDGEPCGVFSWRPPAALVGAVSDLLDGRRRS